MHQLFGRSSIASALWQVVYCISSSEGRLLPQLFGRLSTASALCELVYVISSLEGRLLPQLFGRSSIASALWKGVHGISSLEGRLLHQLFRRSSIASAFWKVVYCLSSSEGRLLHQLFGRSSIASALRHKLFGRRILTTLLVSSSCRCPCLEGLSCDPPALFLHSCSFVSRVLGRKGRLEFLHIFLKSLAGLLVSSSRRCPCLEGLF